MTYIYDEILDEDVDPSNEHEFFQALFNKIVERTMEKLADHVLEKLAAQPAIVPFIMKSNDLNVGVQPSTDAPQPCPAPVPAPGEPAAVVVYPALRTDTIQCPSCGQKVGWYRQTPYGFECPAGCYQTPESVFVTGSCA
jgi:hypothetical protein